MDWSSVYTHTRIHYLFRTITIRLVLPARNFYRRKFVPSRFVHYQNRPYTNDLLICYDTRCTCGKTSYFTWHHTRNSCRSATVRDKIRLYHSKLYGSFTKYQTLFSRCSWKLSLYDESDYILNSLVIATEMTTTTKNAWFRNSFHGLFYAANVQAFLIK